MSSKDKEDIDQYHRYKLIRMAYDMGIGISVFTQLVTMCYEYMTQNPTHWGMIVFIGASIVSKRAIYHETYTDALTQRITLTKSEGLKEYYSKNLLRSNYMDFMPPLIPIFYNLFLFAFIGTRESFWLYFVQEIMILTLCRFRAKMAIADDITHFVLLYTSPPAIVDAAKQK